MLVVYHYLWIHVAVTKLTALTSVTLEWRQRQMLNNNLNVKFQRWQRNCATQVGSYDPYNVRWEGADTKIAPNASARALELELEVFPLHLSPPSRLER